MAVAMELSRIERAIERFNAIPRLNYGVYPTPIEEAPRFREALGGAAPRVFIKRDDYTGPGFGGNKVRKLEYVLAKAVADGAEVVITSGGVKSNHARVTAAMCARLGLRCVLVLNSAAVAHEGLKPASLAVDELFGAEAVRVASREERATTVESVAEKLRVEGKKVAVIPIGASIPLGALGFVRAVKETKAQVEAMNMRIDYIFHSSSSGGTQAGIVAGCQLFDWREAQVVGLDFRRGRQDHPRRRRGARRATERGRDGVGRIRRRRLRRPIGAGRRGDRVLGADRRADSRPGLHREGDGRVDRLGSQRQIDRKR